MIATLKGRIQDVTDSRLIVEIGGIGYGVHVPSRIVDQLTVGSDVFVHTYQHVREDALELFGFLDRADRLLFERLIQVSGVGPKLGLTMLSHYTAQQLHSAIIGQDVTLLNSISGIGKKTAQRLIVELAESMADVVLGDTQGADAVGLVDALMSLGYSQPEAAASARNVDQSAPLEEQVKAALQSMG
jgi:Holliday junction DNA helicase RuvA